MDLFKKLTDGAAKTAPKAGTAKSAPVKAPAKKAAAKVVKPSSSGKQTKGWFGGDGGSQTNLDKWYGESRHPAMLQLGALT